ncbi:MAG: DUF1294 domain-containing protein [Turicibacter sp.]|nr:DUF1294 domain-containing protein [Turicibacter sp.]
MWWIVFFLINGLGYCLMAIDKRRAILKKWRISEKTLFTCATCFGSFGIYLGMKQFRHKTKHWSFKLIIPCLMVIQLLIIYHLQFK